MGRLLALLGSRPELGPELRPQAIDHGVDHWFDLLVGQGAVGCPELESEREALVTLGDHAAPEDVEEQGTVKELAGCGLEGRLHRSGRDILVDHEGEVPSDRRESRDLDEPEAPGGGRPQRLDLELGDGDPSLEVEGRSRARVKLADDADGTTLEEDPGRPPRVDRFSERLAERPPFHVEILEERLDGAASVQHVGSPVV